MKYRLTNLVFWVGLFLCIGLLFQPAIVAPPVGDDLINPFYQFYYTGGSFSKVLHLGYEYGTSHKFDIFGQTVFVLHSWLWLQFDHLTGLSHFWFYYLTKWINFSIVIASITYWLTKVLQRSGTRYKVKKLAMVVTLTCGATIQLHSIWSNDPVGNYPLSGFAAASLGFLTLGMLTNCMSHYSRRSYFITSLLIGLAILYYEINISLIASAFVVWNIVALSERRTRNLKNLFIDGLSLSVVPVLVVIYGKWVTSGKTGQYGGTTIGDWSKFPKTTSIALIGNLPGGAWALSKRFVNTLDFPNYLVLVVATVVITFLVFLTSDKQQVAINKHHLRSWALALLPALIYWLASTCFQTMTDKYQNEIVEVGQTYNFYSQGFMFLAGVIALICIAGIQKRVFIPLTVGVLLTFGSMQFLVNHQLLKAVRQGNGASINLLNAYDPSWSDESRCKAWAAWASGAWPEYYEQGMAVGLRTGFRSFYNKDFCKIEIAPIP